MGLYEILKASKLGAGAAPDMYTALFAQKIKGGGEAELSGVPPLTFRSNGTPLLDYLITGNTTQSGTPTPDSPIMPQGTGKRTGNLWDEETLEGYYNSSGSYTYVTGQLCTKNKIPVTPNTQYWLGVPATDPMAFLSVSTYNSQGAFVERFVLPSYSGAGVQYTTNANTYYINVNFSTYYGDTYKNNVMICEGSTVMPYEPYGYKIPISSANTTTPVYLGEVETTRMVRKLVLTGEENWIKSTTYQGSFYLPQVLINCALQGLICTHAEYTPVINATEYIYGKCAEEGSAVNKTLDLYLGDSSWTVADFKAYLAQQYAAGTPVTVWYVLATPTTGIVNEPLMRIGDYADTLSKEQAGVTIPTSNGSTTVDVDTTVKPSEVYIKYMGV